MKKLSLLALTLLVAQCAAPVRLDARGVPIESAAQHDARMQWWRDARFGMFIHWGLYSIPAGKWGSNDQHGEWIRETAQIPLEQYLPLQRQFDPAKYDARAWARMAQQAGMRYVVITSKHHDGFSLYDSALSDWDMGGTPSKRDLLGELKAACEAEGLRFCTYHSIMDWHHPDYLPRRGWEKRSSDGASFPRYVAHLNAQVAEIVERYQPAVMWFDGEWESTWTHELGVELYAHCRSLAPSMLVNNRVDVHRAGMAGFSQSTEAVGDFGTPEQEVPERGLPGVDWETCMTMNDHWGYCAADANWKSARECIRTLVDVASKGGNFLFNVGPRADGTFPPEAVERLAAIGAWMQRYGDAIHGTQASPLGALPFGRCTMRAIDGGTRLYLHVYDWPANGELVVPGLGNEPRGGAERRGDALIVRVPSQAPDADVSVVTLDIAGAPIVYQAPAIAAPTSLVVGSLDVAVHGGDGLELRATTDGSEPTTSSPLVRGPIRVTATTTVKARAFHAGRAVSAVTERTFTAVEPRRGAGEASATTPGVLIWLQDGDHERVPELPASMPVDVQGALYEHAEFALPDALRRERVAAAFYSEMYVPEPAAWVFELSSDDGSKLWIGDELVIDHDGLHGTSAKRGEVALGRGWHRVRATWFNKTGGAELVLRRAKAGEPLAPIHAEELRAFVPPSARRP
ncbi:MAG: hypothetical protein EPO68_00470 [Planctomycetota bacterium]|nr:MAG: hypothetical protein EPO68_00470 [Planctomycetota bacterium]